MLYKTYPWRHIELVAHAAHNGLKDHEVRLLHIVATCMGPERETSLSYAEIARLMGKKDPQVIKKTVERMAERTGIDPRKRMPRYVGQAMVWQWPTLKVPPGCECTAKSCKPLGTPRNPGTTSTGVEKVDGVDLQEQTSPPKANPGTPSTGGEVLPVPPSEITEKTLRADVQLNPEPGDVDAVVTEIHGLTVETIIPWDNKIHSECGATGHELRQKHDKIRDAYDRKLVRLYG
jgi:hypothetical protein